MKCSGSCYRLIDQDECDFNIDGECTNPKCHEYDCDGDKEREERWIEK